MKKLNLNALKVQSFVTASNATVTETVKGGRDSNNRACCFDSDTYCEDTITVYFGTCLYPC